MNQLAVSLAGHDKDGVYAIVREENGAVYLADGRIRTMDRPKKKNSRHIRRIKNLPKEIEEELGKVSRDSDLVHVLKMYHSFRMPSDL